MDTEVLSDAVEAFYAALNTLLDGNPRPMFELWSRADDVSYMGPLGERVVGWEPIRDSWQEQSEADLGATVRPEELHLVVSGPIGFSVGYERGTVTVDGQEQDLEIRATNIFRLEDGVARMIGHHTDRF